MLRHCASTLIVFCVLVSSVYAEKITFKNGFHSTEELRSISLDPAFLTDQSFQESVMAAAPFGWHESPGADVWWVSYEGIDLQVKVFPDFQRPGNGQPNCCVHFEFEGTEFWLQIKGSSASTNGSRDGGGNSGLQPGAGAGGGSERAGSGAGSESAGRGGGSERGNVPNGEVEPSGSADSHLSVISPHAAIVEDSQLPVISPHAAIVDALIGGGATGSDNPPNGPDASGNGFVERQVVISQAPEPGILVLLGLAGLAASRRRRNR